MGSIGILLGILCFGSFMLIVNKSQLDKCNLFVFTGALYLTGMIFSCITVIADKKTYTFPGAVVNLAVMAGAASVIGFLFQLVALNSGGRLSVINIIGNFSSLIPIVYSIVFFNEKVGITKYIGIFLFLLFIFLLNSSNKEESI